MEYREEPLLAPSAELLEDYQKKHIAWTEFETRFVELLDSRNVATQLDREAFKGGAVLLCSEAKPDRCHRRFAAEYLKAHWKGVSIQHL